MCLSGCVWVCLLGHRCLSSVTAEDSGLKSGLINIECFDGLILMQKGIKYSFPSGCGPENIQLGQPLFSAHIEQK